MTFARPRNAALAAAIAVAASGCGGGGATRLADVRPCLGRLGVVTPSVPLPPEATTPPHVDARVNISFENVDAAREALNVDAVFFDRSGNLDDYNRWVASEQSRSVPVAGPWPTSELVTPSVLLIWNAKPTSRQRRRVASCFA